MRSFKIAKSFLCVCITAVALMCIMCVVASAEEECTHAHFSAICTATCEDGGIRYNKCDDCRYEFGHEIVGALGHVLPEEYEVTDATCKEVGEKFKVCEVCQKKVESIELPITDHESSDWIKSTSKPVTCTTDGEEYKECVHCHEVLEVKTVEALGHKMLNIKHVDSTCTKDGHTEGKVCANCGLVELQSTSIPAAHKGEVIIPAVEATKDAEGKTEGKMCSVCGAVLLEQTVIPKIDNTWIYVILAIACAVIVLAVVAVIIVLLVKKGRSKKAAKLADAAQKAVCESECEGNDAECADDENAEAETEAEVEDEAEVEAEAENAEAASDAENDTEKAE